MAPSNLLKIKRLAHICLGSTDLAAAEKFYCDILGFKKKFDFIKAGEVIGFYLEIAEKTFMEIFKSDVKNTKNCNIQHICFEVEDIDKIILQLKNFHFEMTTKILGADNTWQLWLTGPDNVKIEFHQYTEKSNQFTGKSCILD
jgi:catechol 2,3-dioxygenase-like lactoylglutathione lyase family enzyme